MSGDWQSNWNAEAELRPGKPNTPCILLSLRASLNAYHDLSTESDNLNRTAWYRCFAAAVCQSLSMQSDSLNCACRPEESGYAALGEDKAGILADVLHGPVLTKARSGLECKLAECSMCAPLSSSFAHSFC